MPKKVFHGVQKVGRADSLALDTGSGILSARKDEAERMKGELLMAAWLMVSWTWIAGAEDMPMLNWMGRKETVGATKRVEMKILREDASLSYGDASAGNLLVHGDNLEALKALLPFYAGRV